MNIFKSRNRTRTAELPVHADRSRAPRNTASDLLRDPLLTISLR